MKKIILALVCLIGITAFGQNNLVDVIIDGKPAKMNTTTGVYTFTNGSPNSYTKNNTITESTVTATNTVVANVSTANTDTKIHSVSKGETLYAISKKYGISVAHIKSLNKLSTNTISINQQLKIGYNASAAIQDSPSTTFRTTAANTLNKHIVKKGETLYRIAKNNKLTVQALKALNNLHSNTISIGQELTIK